MTAMQVYAAYAAPIVLVLMGFAVRAWSFHRISQAGDARARKAKV